ncbi:MAG: SIR2 family protein [Alphaproteobacteria bacterium]|nr:MAG: SIR2 family protein [Alphaproteobacteria bacterium]
MIRDFKAQIFCRENKLSKREIDTSDPIWIERIDEFFRRTSILPPDGDPTEYAAAFEEVYPQPRHRRQYIDDAISKGTPSFGHKVLGSLIAAKMLDCIFTTNFDPLIEEAAISANALLPIATQMRPTVAAIDSSDRAMRCLNESDWPLVAKLHGDYQSVAIKNTGSELEAQDTQMRHVLVEAGKRFGMAFVGYSGRDASVMDALNSVLDESSPFPNGLYWVAPSVSRLLPAVVAFLERAQSVSVDVAIVECTTFDELAAEMLGQAELPPPLLDHVMLGRPTPRLVPVQVPTAEARRFPVLRYSALVVEAMPLSARRIRLAESTTSAAVRIILKEKRCRATVAANGRELAVFGNDQEVLAALGALGAEIAGVVELSPERDSWALGLLYDALIRALSRHRPLIPRLRRSGHSLVVSSPRDDDASRSRNDAQALAALRRAYGANLTGKVPTLGFPFQEGVSVKLEQVDGRWWCGFEPYTFVQLPRDNSIGSENPDALAAPGRSRGNLHFERVGDPAGDWRRERWAQKYNKQWSDIIGAWARLLTDTPDGKVRAFGLAEGSGIDAVFELLPVTGWSRPAHNHAYFDRRK